MSIHVEEDPDNLIPGVEIRNLHKVHISFFTQFVECTCERVNILLTHTQAFTFAHSHAPAHAHIQTHARTLGVLARSSRRRRTFPPLSIARYSFIQLSRQGRQWREGKCPIFQTVAKGDSNPGSLDCESGILPLS